MQWNILDFKYAWRISIIGFIATYVGIFLSVYLSSSWFSWTENALSDIGVNDAAIIFNSSMFIGGISSGIFAIAYIMRQERKLPIVAGYVILLQSIFLFCIGLFVEGTRFYGINLHVLVAMLFFLLIPISMLIVLLDWVRNSAIRKYAIVPLVLSFVTPLLIIYRPWHGVAIPEILSSGTFAIWIAFLTYMELYVFSKGVQDSVNGA